MIPGNEEQKITSEFLDWCISAIANVDATTREYLKVSLEESARVKTEESPPQLEELSDQIQQLILCMAAPDKNILRMSSQNRTLQLVEELRCRTLAVALISFLVSEFEEPEQARIERFQTLQSLVKTTSLTFNGPNIISSYLSPSLVVIMPILDSSSDEQALLDILSQAEDRAASGLTCLLDLSAGSALSPRLLATLMSQRSQLRGKGGSIKLCWLIEDSVPAQLFRSTQSAFSLKKVAGHWFSVW